MPCHQSSFHLIIQSDHTINKQITMSDSWQDGVEDNRIDNSIEDVPIQDQYSDPAREYSEGIRDMEALGLTDIGALGSWSVSSYKQGSGIKELREDTNESYWQSDGQQPHHLDIHFSKSVTVTRLSIFTDYSQDESYTPSKILVLSGSGFHDLIEVATLNLNKPIGWKHIVFDGTPGFESGLKTFLIRLSIVANHQHGKDTHLRSVKIYSPMVGFNMSSTVLGGFTSMKLLSESCVR